MYSLQDIYIAEFARGRKRGSKNKNRKSTDISIKQKAINKALIGAGLGTILTTGLMLHPVTRKGYLTGIAKRSKVTEKLLDNPKSNTGKIALGVYLAGAGYGLLGGGLGTAEGLYLKHRQKSKGNKR